jgi:hypothetical protein
MCIMKVDPLTRAEFDVARRMIRRLENDHALSPKLLQEAVLVVSREFYDNAETGNLHNGDMKLAYEWYVRFALIAHV